MDENSGSMLIGSCQIVRLKEKSPKVAICNSWPKRNQPSLGSTPCGIPPDDVGPELRRLNSVKCCDFDEESCHSPEPPADVGPELRRFIIPTSYLSHSLFKVLLEKVEEEFRLDHTGALTIPCEIETFKFLLQCMENHPKDHEDEGPDKAEDAFTLEE